MINLRGARRSDAESMQRHAHNANVARYMAILPHPYRLEHALSWINTTHRMARGGTGYHFGIERVGKRYEILCGRMMNEDGAHCIGLNGRSIGVCFIGNFDNVPPPCEQWDFGVRLVKSLISVFRVPVGNVRGHRAFASWKSCPGLRFDMDLFRRQLT